MKNNKNPKTITILLTYKTMMWIRMKNQSNLSDIQSQKDQRASSDNMKKVRVPMKNSKLSTISRLQAACLESIKTR